MEIRDLVSVALAQGEQVSLTFDPSPEAEPEARWIIAIGGSRKVAGETPERALLAALRHLRWGRAIDAALLEAS
jgi:hypothetical protein